MIEPVQHAKIMIASLGKPEFCRTNICSKEKFQRYAEEDGFIKKNSLKHGFDVRFSSIYVCILTNQAKSVDLVDFA